MRHIITVLHVYCVGGVAVGLKVSRDTGKSSDSKSSQEFVFKNCDEMFERRMGVSALHP